VDECAPRIKQKILNKRKLRKKWQTTRSPQDKAIFNKAKHELKLLLNDLKQQAIQSYLESSAATEATEYLLWKATKRLNRPQTHIPPLRTAAGGWAKSDTQKTHVFQPYDSEIPDVEERETLHPQEAPSRLETPAKKIQNYRSTGCDKNMRTKKAPGYDLITGRILKELPEVGLRAITIIFNSVMRTGCFPAQWKVSQIITILKPGKLADEVTSYKPISLLTILSRETLPA
jgi:hypothetical protein